MTSKTTKSTILSGSILAVIAIFSVGFVVTHMTEAAELEKASDTHNLAKIQAHLERIQNDKVMVSERINSFTATTEQKIKDSANMDLKRINLLEKLTTLELEGKKNSPEARAVFSAFANTFDESEIIRNPSIPVSDPELEIQGNILPKAHAYTYNLWDTNPPGDTRYSCANNTNITGGGDGSVTAYSTYSYLVGKQSYPSTIDSGTSPNCHSTMYWDDEYAFVVFYIYNLPWISCGLDTPNLNQSYGTTCGVLTEGDVIYVMPKPLYENLPATSQYVSNPSYDTLYL